MKFKKIGQGVIIPIAFLVAFLLTLPRILVRYDITEELTDAFSNVTFNDIVFRFVFVGLFFWIVIQFNANWKYEIKIPSVTKRLVVSVLLNLGVFAVFVIVFNFLYPLMVQNIGTKELGLIHFINFIIAVVLVFLSDVLRYQLIHNEDVMEKERLKREKLKSELSALKNQVNPHFLFNSLNSLNTLIRENQPATIFVNKLSYLYRYILQSGNKDLVTLKEELEFLESYVHLIKTRYQDRFSITVRIENNCHSAKVPTMALQLLVENAVKHNEISENTPLHITIFIDENHLVVQNNIQPKSTYVDSTGNGLANLNQRYKMLKGSSIVITSTNNIFSVKLPLSENI
ncbi:sensor histidine kinase [uncultured Croceitalea sp.]|uniref:sensor histidine kinase n=1 Tax=uncultured Croceitalea sp. TaxID=1798908 RepID=UPI00374EAFBF